MTNTLQKKWRKSTLIGLGILGLASNAQAAVIIYFEQIDSDVKVSAVGTLSVDPTKTLDITTSTNNALSVSDDNRIFSWVGENFQGSVGASLATGVVTGSSGSGAVGSSFGFLGGTLIWDLADITGGSVGAVSQFTWSADKDWFIRTGTTLAGINADARSNQLAWTAATTGDTISLHTGSPVPEPSGIILFGMSNLILLLRRHRQ
jgi:hypothetical protein